MDVRRLEIMSKNLIPIIADHLGIQIDEEFDVNIPHAGKGYYRYKLTKQGLVRKEETGEWCSSSGFLEKLICGDFEIIKLPYEPKYGEKYWTYAGSDGYGGWGFYHATWTDSAGDYVYKSAGCIFRTKEEAIATLFEKYKQLTGKELEMEWKK
jgi:hypothetical protein